MHRGNNYGSALQVYALSEKIKQYGYMPIILDYIPDRINEKKLFIQNLKKLFRGSFYDKYQVFRGMLIRGSSYLCYNRFFKKNLYLTKKYYGIEDVLNNFPEADIYMTGSDQVWNSVHNYGIDPVFFLAFAPNNKPKVSYAASFGRERINDNEIDETRLLLSRYRNISVREKSGLKILNFLGVEKENKWVLDPTFLLDRTEWRKKAILHRENSKYVLIYSVEPDKKSVIHIARNIADYIGAKVYMVEWGRKPYQGVDKMISLVDPLMLIDYFDKAEFIVASSFHGTALSLNFNKQFVSIYPACFSTRVESILNLVGLDSRLIKSIDFSLEMISNKIDYTKVNKRIDKARNESINYLYRILQ